MRVAYIWANTFWQVSILSGGAVLTFLSSSGWWIFGAIILMFLAGMGMGARLDKWSKYDLERERG